MADHKQHPTYWPTASHHKDPRTCAKVLCPWLPSWGLLPLELFYA